jgi:2,3-dihydroxybenzoate-AMP ligase
MLAGCTPWPEALAEKYRAKGYWEGLTVPEAIERTIRAVPDKTALVDGERRITYAELGRRVDRLAYAFVRQGLAPQDRVIFQLANSAELPIVFLALLKVGVIPVMALPAHRHSEIGHFVEHSQASAYFIPDVVRGFDYRAMAAELAVDHPSLKAVYVLGEPADGQIGLRDLVDAEAPDMAAVLADRRPPSSEVALMLLSGGTTATPKMIPRTHDDYVYNFKASGQACGFHRDMVYLAVLPMAHNFTLGCPGLLGVFAVGGTVVVATATAPEEIFPLIEKERVSLVCTAVPLVTAWLNSPIPAQHDLSSLKFLINGGAKLVPELRRRIEEQFGCIFMESFGTGEGLLNKTRPDDPPQIRYTSSGRPVSPDDEIRIVDEYDRDVPDGQPGELLSRGPYTMRGYYNAPEANRQAFTADGFYRMGDVVKRVDGYLYVEGRRKDLINRGGEKISCEEVEDHILAHPAVEGACVVAMPDPVYGEKGCAFVLLKPGQRLDFDQFVSFLLGRNIAKFKLPERLEIVESFPISPAGKILRRELRERIAATLAEEKENAALS